MVEEGTFRRDLFYRLEVIPLSLPPLCDRGTDIELLAKHFIRKKCGEMNIPLKRLTSEALTSLGQLPLAGQCARAGKRHRAHYRVGRWR